MDYVNCFIYDAKNLSFGIFCQSFAGNTSSFQCTFLSEYGYFSCSKYFTIHDGPGLAHMANFSIDLKDIFIEKNKISLTDVSKKMPFSVRRYELEDMNKNGYKELFLLGDRGDGRKSDKMIQGAYVNQRDYKFTYDFEANKITTFEKQRRLMIMVYTISTVMVL